MANTSIRKRLAQSAAVLAITAASTSAVYAQDSVPADSVAKSPTAQETVPASAGSDIVVTGTRIGSSGFNTPTPVTVATAEALKGAAPGNLADGLNQLPVFAGSIK